jgi:creatinine amidohydrolase
MAAVHWHDLTRGALVEIAPESVLVLPLGATEQHGPHLPTATDTLVVTELAWRGAEQAACEAVVAPTLAYGASHHHLPFGGTLSLTNESLLAALRDLLGSAATDGFERVMLVNGHGGNAAITRVAASEEARTLGLAIGFASYWDLWQPPAPAGQVPGHAGWFETSMVLALAPGLVHMDDAGPPPRVADDSFDGALSIDTPGAWIEIGGFSDDPRGATAEAGEELLSGYGAAVAAAIERVAAAGQKPL